MATVSQYCHQYFFGDLFDLNTYKGIKMMGYSWEIDWNHHHHHFFKKRKENNENDMAVLIFVGGPSKAKSGTHLLALNVKPVILKPLKDSTSSFLHNLLPQNCTNVITGGQWTKRVHGWSTKSSIVWQFFSEFLLPTFWFGTPTKKKSNGTEFIALVKKQPEKRNCLELPNN